MPVVSSAQMLDWLDGRNGSSFKDVAYAGGQLSFSVVTNPKARGLEAMLPGAVRPPARCRGLTRGGQPVAARDAHGQGRGLRRLQGRPRRLRGHLRQRRRRRPAISSVNATADADGHATVTWETDEPAELARGLRPHHRARQPGLRQRPRDRAQRRAHRAEPQHHLPLPRDLGRRRGQLGQLAGRRARPPRFRRRPARSWTTAPPSSRAGSAALAPTRARPSPAPTARCSSSPTIGEEFEGAALPSGLETCSVGPGRRGEDQPAARWSLDGASTYTTRPLRRARACSSSAPPSGR